MTTTTSTPGPLATDRLSALREAAKAVVDAGYQGAWSWRGTPDNVRLVDRTHGEVFDVDTEHRHWRYWPQHAEQRPIPCPADGYMSGNYCHGVDADGNTPDQVTKAKFWDDGPEEQCFDHHEIYPVIRFMTPEKFLVPCNEIPVFEVCREATSADDPRVYRQNIVGLRHPTADYLARADAATVLALVDEVIALRQKAEAAP